MMENVIFASYLTHISIASFLWDICKQNSPRCDVEKRGVPSGAILFAYENIIKKNKNEKLRLKKEVDSSN